MRSAPAVDAPLASGQAERALIMLLHGCALAVAGVWLADTGWAATLNLNWPPAFWSAITGLLGLGWGREVARRLLPSTPWHLQWTGLAWHLHDDTPEQPVQVDLQIDAGRWLLLRCRHAVGGSRWAVARAGAAGSAWHGLRVALQAHAGDQWPAEVPQP